MNWLIIVFFLCGVGGSLAILVSSTYLRRTYSHSRCYDIVAFVGLSAGVICILEAIILLYAITE